MANSRFQAVLNQNNTETPPVWFMRQAGRYHQHYQKLRAQSSFLELCRDPSLAAQVALGPVEDFDFDVAILFSDILFPLEALGRSLDFTDQGPKLGPWSPLTDFGRCRPLDIAAKQVEFQGFALKETRKRLPETKSLVGFIGGPWTLFTYWIEESHKGPLIQSKKHLGDYFKFLEVLEPLLEKIIAMQLANGAEMVPIFDTSAGELSPELFEELVTPVIGRLAERYPQQLLYYSRGTQPAHFQGKLWQESSALLGVGIDHRWRLKDAFKLFPDKVIQGNFDQTYLFLEPPAFQKRFRLFIEEMKASPAENHRRWVAALGHGVLPKTPEENVRWAVQHLREVWS